MMNWCNTCGVNCRHMPKCTLHSFREERLVCLLRQLLLLWNICVLVKLPCRDHRECHPCGKLFKQKESGPCIEDWPPRFGETCPFPPCIGYALKKCVSCGEYRVEEHPPMYRSNLDSPLSMALLQGLFRLVVRHLLMSSKRVNKLRLQREQPMAAIIMEHHRSFVSQNKSARGEPCSMWQGPKASLDFGEEIGHEPPRWHPRAPL
mmetsp:Transcript_12775/g.24291  ORF Transcript_12775/g.24291 Transcript_12775/m.24291 type:complete len:205 (+) Transcript_12775:562-1176(+)